MLVFDNATLVDAQSREPRPGHCVAIEGDTIREVCDRPIALPGAERIDLKGRTLMPGLIDAHCHVMVSEANLRGLAAIPHTLMAARASRTLAGMLARGFTTVRDAGGADWGLKAAVEEGFFPGPRLFISGRPLSQTGGHGDQRLRTEDHLACACTSALGMMTMIADGVPAVTHAAREVLRQGADQVKIMVSGGVISPYDPIDSIQYTAEEIRAIVHEAVAWNTYVAAHAYGAQAIRHAVDCGVRTIEHGNLIDEPAAQALAASGGFMVPTLVTYEALHAHGRDMGLSEAQRAKAKAVREAGLASVAIAARAGVALGFGTDLLGIHHHLQSQEFALRREVQDAWDVIASATAVNAKILGREATLGIVAAGALADLLVVEGNPLADLGLLDGQGRHLAAILQAGRFAKRAL